MRIIAKNFRGFKYIDINTSKNSFIVGDNSSGKTSIIHLIDYISRSDLFGIPELDDEYYINKNDFFSPYFDNQDVVIGFEDKINDNSICRLITIKKAGNDTVIPTRSTHASPTAGICTIRLSSDGFEAAFSHSDNISLDEILRVHHNEDLNFTPIEQRGLETVNDQQLLFRIVTQEFDQKIHDVQALIFDQLPSCRHIGPIRAAPESFYRFDRRIKATGAHFPSLMQDLSAHKSRSISKAIRKFGRESGLFDDLFVKRVSAGVENAPIMAIVKRGKRRFMLNQVGFGISQVAPIIVETQAMEAGILHKQMVLLEQPELHLHPVAQASLGEYLFEISNHSIPIIVETHSDYLIDRFRARIKETRHKAGAQIMFCTSSHEGNRVEIISIGEDGKLIDPPDSYYEFFLDEIERTIF